MIGSVRDFATVSRWAMAIAALILPGPAGGAPITALAFAPDNRSLVSSGDRSVEIRSPTNGVVGRRISVPLHKVMSLAFGNQGRVLAVGGGEPGVRGEVHLLSWPQGEVLHRLEGHTDVVQCVAFDADGTRLGVASSDGSVKVWLLSAPRNKPPVQAVALLGHTGPVLALAFSPSGRTIVSAGADRSIKVWNVQSGALERSFSQHAEAIHALAFKPMSGEAGGAPLTCISSSSDRTVRLWQPDIGRMVRIVRGHSAEVFALAWSADGNGFYSAGAEGTLREFDAQSDAQRRQWQAHDDWVYALAVSPDGRILASGDASGRLILNRL